MLGLQSYPIAVPLAAAKWRVRLTTLSGSEPHVPLPVVDVAGRLHSPKFLRDMARVGELAVGRNFTNEPGLPASLRNRIRVEWPDCVALGRGIRACLDRGPGFVIIDHFPMAPDPKLQNLMFLSLALCAGVPMTHENDQTTIWEIRPRNVKRDFPTYSETSGPAPLHTDGAYKTKPPDYIAMMMVHPAPRGGELTLADGGKACEAFAKTAAGAHALALLAEEVPFRLPSAYATESTLPNLVFAPAISQRPFRLRFRTDSILAGLMAVEHSPQTHALVHAAISLSEFLDAAPTVSLPLQAGQLIFLDNTRILHGRHAFLGERLVKRIWMRA